MSDALYFAPIWMVGLVAYLLLTTAVCFFFYCAKQVSWRDDEDEQE